MRCGTECFIVTVEKDGEVHRHEAKARSQVEARKMVRKHHGESFRIQRVEKKFR